MRTHGTVVRWNEARGFGFVRPAGKDSELFIHISAFPRGGPAPCVGELISFEIDTSAEKPRGINVQRTAALQPKGTSRTARSRQPKRSFPILSWMAGALVVIIAVTLLLPRLTPLLSATSAMTATDSTDNARPSRQSTPRYRCDGRTHCSQMTSCAEATWFIRNCPSTQMDGDGDGVPCETQWCN